MVRARRGATAAPAQLVAWARPPRQLEVSALQSQMAKDLGTMTGTGQGDAPAATTAAAAPAVAKRRAELDIHIELHAPKVGCRAADRECTPWQRARCMV